MENISFRKPYHGLIGVGIRPTFWADSHLNMLILYPSEMILQHLKRPWCNSTKTTTEYFQKFIDTQQDNSFWDISFQRSGNINKVTLTIQQLGF